MNTPATAARYGKLTDDEAEEITDLMVFGLDNPDTIDGRTFEAFEPLPIQAAARYAGIRVKRARASFSDLALRKKYRDKVEALRSGEFVRNLLTAIAIRDTKGDDTAADRTVRLKAIQTIEGNDAKTSIAVQINNSVTANNVTPGYVVRLQAAKTDDRQSSPAPQRAIPQTIDATVIQGTDRVAEQPQREPKP